MTKGQENNLNHQQAHTYLHLGRDQLEAAEQQALDHHLAGCIACRHYAVEAADLQSRLTRSMRLRWQSQPPHPVINDQVQTRLRRKIWLRQVGRFANSVGATAALCLLVVMLGWLAWRIRPVPDTPIANTTLVAPASPQPPGPSRGDWSTLPGLATFGDRAKLLGYRVSATSFAPGETVGLSLYWQPRSTGYTFFVHLLDANDRVMAQADASEATACPQVSHSTDLMVTCATLTLPQSLPAGTYQVKVGVTNQASGQRLTTPAGQESVWLTSLQIGSLPTPTPTPTPYPIPVSCPVTLPNGNPPNGEPPTPDHHGNGQVWTTLRPNGVLVPPDKAQPDGKLTTDWSWWHSQAGQLTITGRRLDDLALPPLEAEITPGWGDTGFQDSRIIFPSAGCWEVTGRVGNSTLTFVTWVTKVPERN